MNSADVAWAPRTVSQVFSDLLGDAQPILKCAARLARLLEEQFIRDGWPLGRIYGNEADLGRRYGAGRVVVREAARILESRGTARMRCGRKGGLELTVPSIEQLYERIAGYCFLSGVSSDQVQVLWEVLNRVAANMAAERHGNNPVIALFADCAQRLLSKDNAPTRQSGHRTFAEQIVDDLIQSVAPQRWTEGYFLGNQLTLCQRYGVDHRALRQAIRILESEEVVVSLPGRGHGLVARSPGPASISRLICCHLAATHVDHYDAFQAFTWLSMETVALAARRIGTNSLTASSSATAAELDGRVNVVSLRALTEIEDRQYALADNGVLQLFLRSARAFPSLGPFGVAPAAPGALHDLLQCAAQVDSAIAAGDATAAALAQERKFISIRRNLGDALTESWQRLSSPVR